MGAIFQPSEPALALWVGEGLILAAMNEVQRRMTPDICLGMPAAEIVTGEHHGPFLALLRRTLATHRPICWRWRGYEFTLEPDPLGDGRPAVASAARPLLPIYARTCVPAPVRPPRVP